MISEIDVEKCVREVWQELLNVSEINPDQTFFDLGGDSVLMIDMLSTLNEKLGLDVNPGLLFEDSSLRGFAGLIAREVKNADSAHHDLI